MLKKSLYTWYVEALDSFTNSTFALKLPEENFQQEALCGDGVRRDLWECRFSNLNNFRKSRADTSLRFHVFNRRGVCGKIRSCGFLWGKGIRGKKIKKKAA